MAASLISAISPDEQSRSKEGTTCEQRGGRRLLDTGFGDGENPLAK